MKLDDLCVGDIIFVRSGLHDFVHVGICVESGGTFATTKMAHTLGKMQPQSCLDYCHTTIQNSKMGSSGGYNRVAST